MKLQRYSEISNTEKRNEQRSKETETERVIQNKSRHEDLFDQPRERWKSVKQSHHLIHE